MVARREAQQIARRALILGTIAFRCSLEVTSHARVVEISRRLLPWLIKMQCENELDPIERNLLATPLGTLSDSQKVDANWAGERATIFCWMLNRVAILEEVSFANQLQLMDGLSILEPSADQILRSASLRDGQEIEDKCRHFVLIRSILQEARVEPPARDFVRLTNIKRLNDVGVIVTEEAISCASKVVARMTPKDRSETAGLHFVRDHAAMWYLSGRKNYFG